MIAAIPVMNDRIEATISLKFARSPYFAILNRSDNSWQFIENSFVEEERGVGPKVLSFLCEKHGVGSFIAFELGVKLQQHAKTKGVQLIILNENNSKFSDIIKMMGFE